MIKLEYFTSPLYISLTDSRLEKEVARYTSEVADEIHKKYSFFNPDSESNKVPITEFKWDRLSPDALREIQTYSVNSGFRHIDLTSCLKGYFLDRLREFMGEEFRGIINFGGDMMVHSKTKLHVETSFFEIHTGGLPTAIFTSGNTGRRGNHIRRWQNLGYEGLLTTVWRMDINTSLTFCDWYTTAYFSGYRIPLDDRPIKILTNEKGVSTLLCSPFQEY